MGALLALTKSNDERVRLGAIQAALDRGWGRPAQAVQVDADPDTAPVVFVMRFSDGLTEDSGTPQALAARREVALGPSRLDSNREKPSGECPAPTPRVAASNRTGSRSVARPAEKIRS